ncbi:MAG TPA: DNA-binding protein HU, partial [Rhodospirillaceae bacterium]|nr:DNA-binding protein HU [Rhodospirillaceae bacterium]
MADALSNGGEVNLVGFGSFKVAN